MRRVGRNHGQPDRSGNSSARPPPLRTTGVSPPKPCPVCRTNPVAFTNPRVDFCYRCLPGGPFTPPPCRACATTDGYYSAGLCDRCHPAAPQYVTSCKHCLGWGVTRHTKYLCWGCVNWRTKNTYGTCLYCRQHVPSTNGRSAGIPLAEPS